MISRPSVCKWRIRKKGTGFSLPALFDIIPIDVMFHLTWCSVKIRELEKNKHVSLCNIYAASKYYTLKPKCRFYFGCVSIYTTYRRNNYTHRHTQRPFLVLLWQRCLLLLATTNRPSESILTNRLGALQKRENVESKLTRQHHPLMYVNWLLMY